MLNTPFTKRREIEVLPTRAIEITILESESVVKSARLISSISFAIHNFYPMWKQVCKEIEKPSQQEIVLGTTSSNAKK